jgi:hypothetical protein
VVNIEMDLGGIERRVVDGISPVQDRDRWRALVDAVMNLQALQNAGRFSSFCTTGSLSSSTQLHRVS